jgi:hypothetical protein
MAATYTPIASITLGATASSVTFSSIPQTYTDLVLVCNGGVTSGSLNYLVKVNSSATGYSRTTLGGDGSATFSARQTSQSQMTLNDYGYLDTTFGTNLIGHFMNYSNTTTHKTVISRSNNAANGTGLVANLWQNTAAISTMEVYVASSTFLSGSTFNLYGILGANA